MPDGTANTQPSSQCECTVHRLHRTNNLKRVIREYSEARCTRRASVTVGHLSCCKTHARMCREGLVSTDGATLDPLTVREIKRFPHKWPDGFYTWATKG